MEVGEWCRFHDLKGMGHRWIDTRRISDKTEEERLRDRLVQSVSLKDIFDELGISIPDWRVLRVSRVDATRSQSFSRHAGIFVLFASSLSAPVLVVLQHISDFEHVLAWKACPAADEKLFDKALVELS